MASSSSRLLGRGLRSRHCGPVAGIANSARHEQQVIGSALACGYGGRIIPGAGGPEERPVRGRVPGPAAASRPAPPPSAAVSSRW